VPEHAQCSELSLSEAKLRLRQRATHLTAVAVLHGVIQRHPLSVIVLSVLGGGVAARTFPVMVRILRTEPQWVLLAAQLLLRGRRR
jgi:hypothetical protein